jgi:type IV pilus assembly protein PilY1
VDQAPENWKLHLIMETLPSGDAIGPVTAHMNMSSDNDSNIWVYFGTGKYVSITDRSNSDSQYLFGLKDPLFNAARGYVSAAYDSAGDTEPVLDFTADAGLLASDNYRVYTDKSVEVYDSGSWEDLGDFNDLLYLVRWDPDDGDDGDDGDEDEDGDIDSQWLDGWFREMETSGTDPSERCLNEFSILGGAVYATGYTPSEEECSLEGTSSLYGLYYETGTAYYTPLVSTGDEDDPISVRIETGEGVTADPTFSLDGEELISQSSTGSIGQTEVDTAFKYRSRITNWFE